MADEDNFSEGSHENPPAGEEVGKHLDLTKDQNGELIKVIHTVGTGWEKPSAGAEVTVHYTGTLLDGTEFDSSRSRGEPFKFKLGEGQVIKGWDEGVKTMKRGERATLKCAPEYAYGASGSPPKIPPNATLNFDVELISWTEWKDVSANYSKNGTVLKKELTKGEGYESPEFDTVAVVSWSLTVEGSAAVVEEKKDVTVTIGADALPAGLETGIESMKKGERALIKILPSVRGAPEVHHIPAGVPADATLVYEVELTSFEQAPKSWKLTTAVEKFDWANKRRTQGNDLFKTGKVEQAKKKYKASLDYISSDYQMSDTEKEEAKGIKVTIHLNMAACAIKVSDWKTVVEECDKALEIQKANTKALLRRGKAYNEQNRWGDARADLQRVIDTPDAPEVADAKKELAKVTKKIKDQDAKDKRLYGGMFAKINLTPTPPAPEAPADTQAAAAEAEAAPEGAIPTEEEKPAA